MTMPRRPAATGSIVRGVTCAAALALLALAPLYVNSYHAGQMTSTLVFILVLTGLNLATGFGGIISLGHGALFAMGAYTTAVLVHYWGWPYLATLPVAVATTAALGLLIGVPTLRLRGLYLALVTVGVAICAVPFFKRFDWIGASQGLSTPPLQAPLGLHAEQGAYYVALLCALAGLVLARNLVRSAIGRAVRAASVNELAASTYGVDIPSYRLLVFVISAGYAGLAGGIQTMHVGFVSPDSFPLLLSLTFFIGIVVGGLGSSVAGPVLGAIFIEYVPVWSGNIDQSLSGMVYGVVLIVVLLAAPDGAASVGPRLAALFKRRTRAEIPALPLL